MSFIRDAIPAIVDWLAELAADNLPDRETVLDWADQAIRKVLDSTDFPVVNDDLIDPLVLRAMLTLVGKAYDAIADNGPAI